MQFYLRYTCCWGDIKVPTGAVPIRWERDWCEEAEDAKRPCLWTIDVESLEDLCRIIKEAGHRVVVDLKDDWPTYNENPLPAGPSIEIYNDWRE